MAIKSSQTLVSEALKEIKTISTDEAHKLVNDNQCNLIDIRDIRELQKEGQVEGANHIPRGMLEFWIDPNSQYFKEGKLDLDKEMVLLVAETASTLGFRVKSMPSGAGHDAQEMSVICPIGMIFVPSKNGISHSPKEYSSPKDISNGANVLLHTVLKLDEQYDQ
mgnify:CR=1 FL=1